MTKPDLYELRRLIRAADGAWRWGDGWQSVEERGLPHEDRECLREEKYLDLGLYRGATNVIPIGTDHYEPQWDTGVEPGRVFPPFVDRALIAKGLNALPYLLARLEKLERVREAAIVISAGGLWHEETEAHTELSAALRAAEDTDA